jgi:2'-5' RNA ligase
VSKLQFYRYFLCFRPDAPARQLLAAAGKKAGQHRRQLPKELLHFTLCVVHETKTEERDHFVLRRIEAALEGHALASMPIPLGRVIGGRHGALVRTIGRQDAIQDFYSALVRLLRARGIEPLHRKSGLRPHVTLGHDRCDFVPFMIEVEWVPGELLLIESEVGLGKHNVLGRWSLRAPAQGWLPFDEGPFPLLAAGWRLAG